MTADRASGLSSLPTEKQMLTNTVRKVLPTYGYTSPDRASLHQVLEATKFTPDISQLELYEWQLFFAPDEMKRDHPRHDILGAEREFKFPAFTQKKYHFWQHAAPFLPNVPMEAETNAVPFFPPIAMIKGEVYAIRPQRFLELDRYKQNTVEFQRHRVRLVVPYRRVKFVKEPWIHHDFHGESYDHRLHAFSPTGGMASMNSFTSKYTGSSVITEEEKVAIVRAWMYIGKPEFWDPLINAYDYTPVESFKSKNRRWLTEYYNIRRPPLVVK